MLWRERPHFHDALGEERSDNEPTSIIEFDHCWTLVHFFLTKSNPVHKYLVLKIELCTTNYYKADV